ncbi:MAG: beta-N-acetylglucosaminidase domain-containing protein [Candidatus Puniceispirillales bacterium]
MTKPLSSLRRGYIEGYYGRLLDWPGRHALLDVLEQHAMNGYFYAPKEDPAHRFRWRQDWDQEWWQGFRDFTAAARHKGITVIGGIAPGLDFDFASLASGAGDAAILIAKAERLIDNGAREISLLMDDLDPGFHGRDGGYASEGLAHADLANHLADRISVPLSVTPRIYADDIDDPGEAYLSDFCARLDPGLMVWTCGSHIVAPAIDLTATRLARQGVAPERMLIWDNLYAHDYCPRRLFLGPWRGRTKAGHIFLNPTGMPLTDALLLALMAAGDDEDAWQKSLRAHDVPEAFFTVAAFFDRPPDPAAPLPDDLFDPARAGDWLDSLDTLLWRWKSPLQREWYPFLMGLRGDLLYRTGAMDSLRRHKVFPPLITPGD